MSRVFPSHKNASFLIVHTNISTSTRREKASVVVGQSASSHREERTGEGEEGVWISAGSVWTETAKGEERIIIIIITIISNVSNDRSKASSKTIPPHSAI